MLRYFTLVLGLSFLSPVAFAQEADDNSLTFVVRKAEEPEPTNPDALIGRTFLIVENVPLFPAYEGHPAGEDAMFHYFRTNLVYPPKARQNNEQGKVYVNFIVGSDGAIYNTRVLRGVSPTLDSVSLDLIQQMPNWTPGTQRGQAVPVSYNVPITFSLR